MIRPRKFAFRSPKLTFGEIDEQNLFGIHHLAEFERGFLLADNRTNEIVRGEVIKLVRDVRNNFCEREIAFRLPCNVVPELAHDRIHTFRELLGAEFFVRENALRCPASLNRSTDPPSRAESHCGNIVRTPGPYFQGIAVESTEYHKKLVHDKCLLFRSREIVFQEIQPNGRDKSAGSK